MSKYLIRTIETYRCDSEKEATELIDNCKKSNKYSVTKYNSEIRTLKAKGEVIDEWRRVTIVKEFTSEKEPDGYLMPYYTENAEVDYED